MATGSERRMRQNVVSFRVDAGEYARIKAEADRGGVTVSTFARDVLIGAQAPRRVRRPPAEKAALARLLGEVGKLGSNVNQIASKANLGVLRVLDPWALAQIQEDLDEIRDALMRALGRQP